ncbi:MAG: DUF11 domain-containing protein, partial [Thermoanaerobaculia bacterium]|nr:DUF11 domain-containing protein [Thermoanaerobaculia bacterium]
MSKFVRNSNLRLAALAAIGLAATVLTAWTAAADIVPGTRSDDAFDSTSGTTILAHDTIIDPINCFRTSGGFEGGHTLMRNGGLNSVSFIDFQTAGAVSISGVRLFAQNDGAGNGFRRTMNRFRLLADVDGNGSWETLVIDEPVNPDYSTEPGNASGVPSFLDRTLISATVTSQRWRLEVTQGSDVQPFEGARVVEVDAIVLTDVSASISAPASVAPGSTLTVTSTVSNVGSLPAYSTRLDVPTPAGLTFVSNTGNCVTAFPCMLGTLGVGGTGSVTTTWAIPAGYLAPDPIPVSATASVGPSDTNLANNMASANVTLAPIANLSISKSAAATAVPGTTINFITNVSNAGPSNALAVSVADPTPPGLVFVANAGDCATAFPCNLGTIVPGGTRSISTVYSIPSGYTTPDPLSNTATVSASTPDPVPGNNTSTATAPVTAEADLSVLKVGPTLVTAGEQVIYTITVTNNGPSDAAGVVLADTAAPGVSLVENSGDCLTPFPCALGTIAVGATRTVTSTFDVSPSYGGDQLQNLATVSAATADPFAGHNTSLAVADAHSTADVALLLSAPQFAGGDTLTFGITILSLGPSSARAVRIDAPPVPGVSFVSADGPCAILGFPCVIDEIPVGPGLLVTATFRISGVTLSPLVMTFRATATSIEPDFSNNQASYSIDSCPSPVELIAPEADQVDVAQTGTLRWDAINADSFDVYLGPLGTGCSTLLGSTASMTFAYSSLARRNQYEWRVVANKAGCPTGPVSSACQRFDSGPPCPQNGPQLLFPPQGGLDYLSPIRFEWTEVPGAVSYKVWASIDDTPVVVLGTSTTTAFVYEIIPGRIAWYVEAVFNDCPNVFSPTSEFTASGSCVTRPAVLSSPPNGETLGSPITFDWEPVGGAVGYNVWVSVDGKFPIVVASTTIETVASVRVSSGQIRWFVESRFDRCPPAISEIRSITVPPSPECIANASPALVFPLPGAKVLSPVEFQWSAVPGAIGYTVWASIDGDSPSIIASTSGPLSATQDLRSGEVVWFVQAIFDQCPSTESPQQQFTIVESNSCDRDVPRLLLPVEGSISPTSLATYAWTRVSGANEYRVWASVDGGAAQLLGSTPATLETLTIPTPFGVIEWYVEALFIGCPSTESTRSQFTVLVSTSCSLPPAELLAPAEGSTQPDGVDIDFRWNGVDGALAYRLWLTGDSGTPTLLTTTGELSFSARVSAGAYSWFIETLVNGCPSVSSAPVSFTTVSSCASRAPTALSPGDGAAELTSPVTFVWTPVAGAKGYTLWIAPRGAQPYFIGIPAERTEAIVPLSLGITSWWIETAVDGCNGLASSTSQFRVIQQAPCGVPDAPAASAVAEVTTGEKFKLLWDRVPGSTIYEVQQTSKIDAETGLPDFAGSTVLPTTNFIEFTAPALPAGAASTLVYFRVRGIADCNQQRGPYSRPVSVVVTATEQAGQIGSIDPIERSLLLCATNEGQVFDCSTAPTSRRASAAVDVTITPTEPWLTATPSSGTIPTGGSLVVNLVADPSLLPGGTSSAVLEIATASSSRATQSGGSSSVGVSVGLASPVTPDPRTTPPPYSLVIPAVIHANSATGTWQSDMRVANTTAKPQKYQLNFTPSSVDGTLEGKRAVVEVGAGKVLAFDDIVRSWYGAAQTSITGVIEVRPLTTPANPNGDGDDTTLVSSRTYNTTLFGSFGQFIPAIPYGSFIGSGTPGGTVSSLLAMQQISQSPGFRTNFGFVEGSGQPADVLVRIFSSTGSFLGETTLSLKPGQHLQVNSLLAQMGITAENARAEVSVASLTGRVTAYASIVDSGTSDPTFVPPVTLGGEGASRLVIPGVADFVSGENRWRSDVAIFNPSSESVSATMTLYRQGDPANALTKLLTIGPGGVEVLADILRTSFGVADTGGALHLTTSGASNLVATARTYNQKPNGTLGQFIPAVTPAQATALGGRSLQILQAEESDRLRTNVGIAEMSGAEATVEISAVVPGKLAAPKMQVKLAPFEFRQVNSVLR